MSVENLKTDKTPLQLAQEEVKKEQMEKAKDLLKAKLKEKKKAELVLANIERELQDLVDQINQGDIPEG